MSDENGDSTDNGKPPDNGVEDNSELGHLPLRKRKELARIVDIVRDEFEKKLKTATSPPRRGGKLLKILLFGSTARGDWVEDPKGGYYSDYDILLIVNEDVLTDVEFFLPVEAAIADDPGIRTDVTIIVHTLNQVNEDLRDGDYFFADIYHQHIPLWELIETKSQGHRKYNLHKPGKADPVRAHEIAKGYFDLWKEAAEQNLEISKDAFKKGWLRKSAFELHQAAESAYGVFLLTHTFYMPKMHRLAVFAQMVEERDNRFMEIWPQRKPYKGYFRKLADAYIMARYKQATYYVTKEQIEWLIGRVEMLVELAVKAAQEQLERLKAEADAEQAKRDKGDSDKKK